MNLDNFYIITARKLLDENSISVQVDINKDHEVFKGHFPNMPVMPGVAMIQIVKELLEEHLHKKLFLHSANRVKYIAVVNPFGKNHLVFQLSFEKVNKTLKVKNSTTFADETPVMNGIFQFREID